MPGTIPVIQGSEPMDTFRGGRSIRAGGICRGSGQGSLRGRGGRDRRHRTCGRAPQAMRVISETTALATSRPRALAEPAIWGEAMWSCKRPRVFQISKKRKWPGSRSSRVQVVLHAALFRPGGLDEGGEQLGELVLVAGVGADVGDDGEGHGAAPVYADIPQVDGRLMSMSLDHADGSS